MSIGNFEFQLMTMFIIVFYVYNSKIHFIRAIPFIFRFFFLIVTSRHPVVVSLFLSQYNGVFPPSTLLIVIFLGYFLGFLIAHECDRSLEVLLRYELLCWAIILLPYTPPRKPAYGLVLCSGDDTVDGDWSCSETAPLSPILAAGSPPIKICPGSLYNGDSLIVPFVLDHYTTVPRW